MAEKKVRVAVLGQGRSGYNIHVRWLREAREQYELVAVADLAPERHEAASQLGAKAFGDYRELLADKSIAPDLVVNALPSHLHPEGTLAVLSAGYNVLSEKPAAVRVADFDRLVSAAKQHQKHFFVFQNSRFNPAFQKISEVLASGKLGRLIHARISFSGYARRWDWQASQNFWGGNINNTGPHPLDQAVLLFGDRTPRVFAKLACDNEFGDGDNFASVSLYGKDAPLVEVIVSSFMAYPQGSTYNLSCAYGGLTGDFKELKWKYFDPKQAPSHIAAATTWSDNRTYNNEQLPWVEETWTDPDAAGDLFQRLSKGIYDNLYEVLTRSAEPIVKLEQVRKQVAVLEEAHRQNPLTRKAF